MSGPAERPDAARSLHDLVAEDQGDAHCRQVLDEVWLYLDGETDAASRSVIKQHLDDCGPCLRRYGIEREVKALVARCCGQENTPMHLRDRVLTTLRSIVVTREDESHSVRSTTAITVTTSVIVDDGPAGG